MHNISEVMIIEYWYYMLMLYIAWFLTLKDIHFPLSVRSSDDQQLVLFFWKNIMKAC